MEEFDAIVIGAGQAGVPLAKKLAGVGWKTALVEKRLVGGTCINDGCTPTKALIASAKLAYQAGRSKELGVNITEFKVDFKTVMTRKFSIVKSFRESAISGLEKTDNLKLVYGTAKFSSNHNLTVLKTDGNSEEFSANYIFINTGDAPVIPDTEGLKDLEYLTSTSILELDRMPEHLLIVGSGYIGLEFGQMFKRFGSAVTILERSDRLMAKEDDDVCSAMSAIFKEDGIDILLECKALKYEKLSGGEIEVILEQKGQQRKLQCSHVLVATGRKPQTKNLGLENTGVICDEKGHIQVNEFLETDVKNVYALGDVKGGPAFTHISYNDHIIVCKNLLEGARMSTKNRMVPYCMFTDPQLGRIGITEMEAAQQQLDYLVAKIPMEKVARAVETGETRGFMKAIVDKSSRQILGACVIGEQGGEVMSMLQIAMMGGITADTLSETTIAHPLYAESLNNLFMALK